MLQEKQNGFLQQVRDASKVRRQNSVLKEAWWWLSGEEESQPERDREGEGCVKRIMGLTAQEQEGEVKRIMGLIAQEQ